MSRLSVTAELYRPGEYRALADFALALAAERETEDKDFTALTDAQRPQAGSAQALTDAPQSALPPPTEPAKRGRKAAAKPEAAAPTPPAPPEPPRAPAEDSSEVQAQDKADEAAEAAATAPKVQTADDLRAAMGAYKDKFGMEATQKNGVKILIDALGSPPAGNPHWNISLVAAAGPEMLAKAIAAWTAATAGEAGNPFA